MDAGRGFPRGREAREYDIRIGSGLLRFGIVTAPLAALAVWGGAYVMDTLRVLEAPGVPVFVEVSTPGGPVRLSVDSYTVDVRSGYVGLTKPKVEAVDGTLLLSLNRLEAFDLHPLALDKQVVKVRAHGLDAQIVRLPNGSFNFERFLPEKDDTPSKIPFELVLREATVRFEDQTARSPFRQELRTDEVRVSGLGDDWLAGAVVVAPGIGTAPLSLQNVAGFGLNIQTVARDLELAPLLARVFQDPSTPRLTARSLRAQGPIHVFLPAPAAPAGSTAPSGLNDVRLEARLTLEGKSVRFGEYRADQGVFRGILNTAGAKGLVEARDGATNLRFEGTGSWATGALVGGALTVSSPSRSRLPAWVRPLLPDDTDFRDGRFEGWVWGKDLEEYRVQGTLTASLLRFQDETLTDASARVSVSPRRVIADVSRASYQSQPTAGLIAYDPRTGGIQGAVTANRVDLATLGKRFGIDEISGYANLNATLGGTVAKPSVSFTAGGEARYALTDARGTRRLNLGAFQASGRLAGESLVLERSVIQGPLGLVSVRGSLGGPQGLGLTVVGRGLRPNGLVPDLEGSANLVARVSGTLQKPSASGYIEGYNLSVADRLIPVVATDFTADRDALNLLNLRATQGTAEAAGYARLRFADRSLKGELRANGLQIADFLGENFAGFVDVSSFVLSGTLDEPQVTALVTGENLVAEGVKIDALSARLNSVGSALKVEAATAKTAGGTLVADAVVDLKTLIGEANVKATNIDLSALAARFQAQIALAGETDATAKIVFGPDGIRDLVAEGRADGVELNDTLVGAGPFRIGRNAEGRFTGEIQVGSLERYISLDEVTFDPETNRTEGKLALFNVPAHEFVAASRRYQSGLSLDSQELLDSVRGTLTLGATFAFGGGEPTLEVNPLVASDLRVRDVPLGELNVNLGLLERRWDVRRFDLIGPSGEIKVQGTVEEDGDTQLSGDVVKVPLAEISRLLPNITFSTGRVENFSFVASGPTKSPTVRASLEAEGLFSTPDRPEERGLALALGDIRIREGEGPSGGIRVNGGFTFRGFAGTIEGSAPFQFPFTIPQSEKNPAQASIRLEPRGIAQIAPLLDGIDETRSSGTIGGVVNARLENGALRFSGDVSLEGERLAFEIPSRLPNEAPRDIDDVLTGVTARLNFQNDRVAVTASGGAVRGGRFNIDATSPIVGLEEFATSPVEESLRRLLQSPLKGLVSLEGISFRQDLPNRTYVAGKVQSEIELGGTLARPSITGDVSLTGVDSVLPFFEASRGGGTTPVVNPSFDLRINLDAPARVRSSAAEFTLDGSGRVGGTLEYPIVTGNFAVERGMLKLPLVAIRIEQGGTVDLNFRAGRTETIARLDVDLEARTGVTARRFADSFERYDIFLNIRGNVFEDGGLNLTARSEPPDLSQQRILALLGQTDLLETIGTGLGTNAAERGIRDALTGIALPALTDPFFSQIAAGLGLDYLSLEYNPFEQATLAFGADIGSGFFIQGRRQLGAPAPGFLQRFDLRLVYQPRRIRGILNRFRISVGADQDTPLKFNIEYGIRF